MKQVLIAVGIAAQMLAVSAFAQGEVGTFKQAAPASKASPEEKAAARAKRKTEGAAALREQPLGETGQAKTAAPRTKVSADEKAAARAKRRAEGAEAVRQPPLGEAGQSK